MTIEETTRTPDKAIGAEGLLAAAANIGSLLRERAAEGETQGRPTEATMNALREAGLFRLFAPRSLGGLEVDPVTCARVIEAVARFDSAAGWAIMVANSVDWWCSRLPDEGAEEIYAEGPDAIIATAFQPPVEATAADGGYRLSGQGPLASNVHGADWLMLTAEVAGADGELVAIGGPRLQPGRDERHLRPQSARAPLPRRADRAPPRVLPGGALRDGGPGLPRRRAGVRLRGALGTRWRGQARTNEASKWRNGQGGTRWR